MQPAAFRNQTRNERETERTRQPLQAGCGLRVASAIATRTFSGSSFPGIETLENEGPGCVGRDSIGCASGCCLQFLVPGTAQNRAVQQYSIIGYLFGWFVRARRILRGEGA